MKTPEFWKTNNRISQLLWPVAQIYDAVSTLKRSFITPTRLPVPVICVGNILSGGAGKTPFALHLGQALLNKNIKAFYLSRGYGGSIKTEALVNSEKHTAAHVGDEPLLLAKILPTVICADRLAGARYAIQQGAKLIIMDDGFQNPALYKDFSFLVIDGIIGLGNGKIFPAGPLRESPALAFKRAHSIVLINKSSLPLSLPQDIPVLQARTTAQEKWHALKGRKVLAFCGLAYPEKFRNTLYGLGVSLVDFFPFPDHYNYSENDIKTLFHMAINENAFLATTEKDAARIPAYYRQKLTIIGIDLVIDNPQMFDAQIDYISRLV